MSLQIRYILSIDKRDKTVVRAAPDEYVRTARNRFLLEDNALWCTDVRRVLSVEKQACATPIPDYFHVIMFSFRKNIENTIKILVF